MCGEDGTQMVVYKLKEEHAEGGIGRLKKKANTEEEKREKQKNYIYYKKKKTER